MVEQATKALPEGIRARIPEQAAKTVASSLGFGYGMTFGLLYALPRGRKAGSTTRLLSEGAGLGIASWAIGFLGWLPATKLMPPVWKQQPKQVVPSILSHILFGVAVAGAFHALAKSR